LEEAPVDEFTVQADSGTANEVKKKETLKAFVGCVMDFPHFKLPSLLLRKMAESMTLDQQRLAVKRQALVNRVITKDLSSRMEKLSRTRASQHIPYYYLHMDDVAKPTRGNSAGSVLIAKGAAAPVSGEAQSPAANSGQPEGQL